MCAECSTCHALCSRSVSENLALQFYPYTFLQRCFKDFPAILLQKQRIAFLWIDSNIALHQKRVVTCKSSLATVLQPSQDDRLARSLMPHVCCWPVEGDDASPMVFRPLYTPQNAIMFSISKKDYATARMKATGEDENYPLLRFRCLKPSVLSGKFYFYMFLIVSMIHSFKKLTDHWKMSKNLTFLDTSESSESKEQSLRSRSQLVEIPPVLEGQVATWPWKFHHFDGRIPGKMVISYVDINLFNRFTGS